MTEPLDGFGETACQLARAVGLDPSRTIGFTITVFPDRLITVNSQQMAGEQIIEDVCRTFSQKMPDHPSVIVQAIPPSRQADLRQRASASALTQAESLAMAVLRGGPNGENAVGMLIDACLEEFGSGSYRVPVRVIGDKSRMKIVVSMPEGRIPSMAQMEHIRADLQDWLLGPATVAILPAGWSLQAFECDGGPLVEIVEAK